MKQNVYISPQKYKHDTVRVKPKKVTAKISKHFHFHFLFIVTLCLYYFNVLIWYMLWTVIYLSPRLFLSVLLSLWGLCKCCISVFNISINYSQTGLWKQHRFGLHGRCEGGKVFDLSAKDEVSELGEGKENDEEHHGKSCKIFGTSSESWRQLRHGLVETDVLEDLQNHHRQTSRW